MQIHIKLKRFRFYLLFSLITDLSGTETIDSKPHTHTYRLDEIIVGRKTLDYKYNWLLGVFFTQYFCDIHSFYSFFI